MTQKKKSNINNDKLSKFQEQQIEILCLYKQCNNEETVYLSDEDFNKAYIWYSKMQHSMKNHLPDNITKSLESIKEEVKQIE